MSMICTSYTTERTNVFASRYTQKAEASYGYEAQKSESVVDAYKRRHPDSASHVDAQVKAGRAVRAKNGAGEISTEDMTMEAYKSYFYALLDTIPYDSTRIYDDVTISISEKGWEQMKKDPDYEAWVLGYFVEDRAVRNPFFGWDGNMGCVVIERFGASIEEHNGMGFSKSALNGKSNRTSDDEESWWEKRRRKMKELQEEQMLLAQRQAVEKSKAVRQEYMEYQLKSQQNLHAFLTGKERTAAQMPTDGKASKMMMEAYDSTIGLFNSILMGMGNWE